MSYYRSQPKPRTRRQVLRMITSYEQIRDEFLSFGNKERGVPIGQTSGYFRAKMLPFDDRVYITGRNWRADGTIESSVMHLATIYPSGDVELTNNFLGNGVSNSFMPVRFGLIGLVLPIQIVLATKDRVDHGIYILQGSIGSWQHGWNQARAGMPYRITPSRFLFNLNTRKPVASITYDPPKHIKADWQRPTMNGVDKRVRKMSSMTKDMFAWTDFKVKRKKAIATIKALDKIHTFKNPILPYEPIKNTSGKVYYGRWQLVGEPKRLLTAQCLALEGVFNATALHIIKLYGVEAFIESLKKPSKELLFELNIYANGSEWE